MMRNGFLGYDASFMLDVVVCALLLVVPLLAFSLYLIKVRRNYLWHRNIQILLGILLLITVLAFEIDLRVVHGSWQSIVLKNPVTRSLAQKDIGFLQRVLWVHLVFAITTPAFWTATIVLALRRIPNPPRPCAHSALHKRLGWISALDITLTSISGLTFYFFAFVA